LQPLRYLAAPLRRPLAAGHRDWQLEFFQTFLVAPAGDVARNNPRFKDASSDSLGFVDAAFLLSNMLNQ